jgi:hypothetical protein
MKSSNWNTYSVGTRSRLSQIKHEGIEEEEGAKRRAEKNITSCRVVVHSHFDPGVVSLATDTDPTSDPEVHSSAWRFVRHPRLLLHGLSAVVLTPLYATSSRQAYLFTRQNRLCHCCGLAWRANVCKASSPSVCESCTSSADWLGNPLRFFNSKSARDGPSGGATMTLWLFREHATCAHVTRVLSAECWHRCS